MVAPWGPWSFQTQQAYIASSVAVDVAGVEVDDATTHTDPSSLCGEKTIDDEPSPVRNLPHLVAPWSPWSFQTRQAYISNSLVVDVAGVEVHVAIVDSDTATLPLNKKPRDVTYQVW